MTNVGPGEAALAVEAARLKEAQAAKPQNRQEVIALLVRTIWTLEPLDPDDWAKHILNTLDSAGIVLVPRDATDEMVRAAMDAVLDGLEAYPAILNASPIVLK
jgi:hypothetical protein